ncbi:MAG: acyl-CoA desaturase, partial [Pseudoxanthomonas sp.]
MNQNSRNRSLTAVELEGFAAELDGVRARTVATLGQRDADYIRGIVKAVRYTEIGGRVLLFASLPLAFAGLFWATWIAGVLILALSKILENMELGHNVIHGQ